MQGCAAAGTSAATFKTTTCSAMGFTTRFAGVKKRKD
jgi:hypothetical protein